MPWISKYALALYEDTLQRARRETERAEFVAEQLRIRADDAERKLTGAREACNVLERQNAVHQSNNEWLRAQLNTVNFERQQRLTLELLRRGVEVEPDSEITSLSTDKRPRTDPDAERRAAAVNEAMTGQGLFEDMGDDAAKALGIEWTPGGEVVHKRE